ncbi:class I SAM-dependent methyltransferase [Nakamurella deserti]|uniref:class I SAM-dependent methyltransferase n=1 Tax=Nakamurella deserti TaxID=2164074 RepID=UPI000DBEA5DF|nr:class I SAM-dependent methyltransferase [Nakamurella deserti]
MVDWDGAGYEKVSDLQRTLASRSLEHLVVRGDEDCLDVGCGDGYLTRLLAMRLPEGSVLGVDASPRMIEAARRAAVPAGAYVSFELGDASALRFDTEFDLVTSFNALHWVVDQHTALSGIARALVPEGRALLQQVCAGPRPSLEDVAMEVAAAPRWQAAFDGFDAPFVHVDPDGYPDLAAAAGLTVQSSTVTDEEWDFGSREDFAAWCTVGFAPWTPRLDPALVGSWVDDVVERYEQLSGRPGLFRFMQLVVELTPAAVPD